MFQVTGTIEGIADILFNAPPDIEEFEEAKGTKKRPSTMSIEEKQERALDRLHQDARGLFLPPGGFEKCLFTGSDYAGLKDGKRALSTLLKATLFLTEDPRLFVAGSLATRPDYIHEKLGRVPPRTGGMAVIRRPALNPGWQAKFMMTMTAARVAEYDRRMAREPGGSLVGLGGWRPRYGRFLVKEWKRT